MSLRQRSMYLAGLCFVMALASGHARATSYDVLIVGGRVMDGDGNPWFRADVAISHGKVVAIGKLERADARTVVDAKDRLVVPGFIDLHSHADDGVVGELGLRSGDVRRRAAHSLLAQGITTVVVNPDGSAPNISIREQMAQLRSRPIAPNVLLLAGHNTIRRQVMGEDHRRVARPDEIARMRTLVRQAMKEGAVGLSVGLEYEPGRWSSAEELIELARELPPFGGIFTAHMRSEARYPMWWRPSQDDATGRFTLLDSLREVIRVGEMTGATIVATHLKVRGADFWGASQAAIDLVSAARDRGISIYGDQYPYDTSFSDGLIVLVPGWAMGYDAAKAANDTEHTDYAASLETTLSDPAQAAKVRQDVEHAIAFRGGPERITIMDAPDRSLIGKTLAEIAAARAMTAVDTAIRLQLDGDRTKPGGVRARSFSFADTDIVAFMREPWVATATDAEISLPEDGPVHVRNYGTFVRKIAEYSLARHTVTIEHAVRAATGLPAQILGLTDRGCVRPGCAADLLVIDLKKLRELGTFADPHLHPVGIERVFVAGEAVIANGEPTGALPGRVLTRQ